MSAARGRRRHREEEQEAIVAVIWITSLDHMDGRLSVR
jgi:hypothetical protein